MVARRVVAGWVLALLAGGVIAQPAGPSPVLPQDLRWFSPPGNAAVQGAWVLGADRMPGAYVLRVKMAPGARIPPHTHPDERHSTVLSGTLFVGFGESFDESKVVAIPAGGLYVAPANVPHYVWAKDGEVSYQESGAGPTATVPVSRSPASPARPPS